MKELKIPDPSTMTYEQRDKVAKALVKRIIASKYLDGVHSLTAEFNPDEETIAQGKFVSQIKNSNGSRSEFKYSIFMDGADYMIEYSAISGVEDEDAPPEMNEPDSWDFAEYIESLDDDLESEISALLLSV